MATLDIDALVMRFSTIPLSPLSHYQSTINRRMTLLDYAHGRAYLAFCPDEERRHLVALPQQSAASAEEADASRPSAFDGSSGTLASIISRAVRSMSKR